MKRTAFDKPRLTRIDASDVSVVLSVMVDSQDRVDNLLLLIDYFATLCAGLEMIVVEQGVSSRLVGLAKNRPFLTHHVLRDENPHWKTRNLNRGANLSGRRFVIFADCDVVPTPDALSQGLQKLREESSFVQLFDGIMVNIEREVLKTRNRWLDILAIAPHFDRRSRPASSRPDHRYFSVLYGNEDYLATGGCTACRRRDHIVSGGWNENIVSYGFEDQEYFERIETLGGRIERIAGHNAYHLDHERGSDSLYNEFYRLNEAEFEKVSAMDRGALESYVLNGFRRMTFRPGMRHESTDTENACCMIATEDTRTDLGGSKVVVAIDRSTLPSDETGFDRVLGHLERAFRNYLVILQEMDGRRYKYLGNKYNVDYRMSTAWSRRSDDVATKAHAASQWPTVRLGDDVEKNIAVIEEALTSSSTRPGAGPASGIERPPSRRANDLIDRDDETRTSRPGWDPSNHAIYLSFDDHYIDYARACINSIRRNFPSHPVILADYAGNDLETMRYLERVQVPMLESFRSGDFADQLGTGPVGNEIVFNRFRLWGPEFDRFDSVLHLDADTLVLGDLSEFFSKRTFAIVANREPTRYARIFDPIHEFNSALDERLTEDGLPYPTEADDLANAGVFLLPRELRHPSERDVLVRMARRYGDFFAYADQSLISLWCLKKGLPFLEDFRYNYQTTFLTDPSVKTALSEVRIFHFSSSRKPGSSEFRNWDRVGPYADILEDAFRYYLELP